MQALRVRTLVPSCLQLHATSPGATKLQLPPAPAWHLTHGGTSIDRAQWLKHSLCCHVPACSCLQQVLKQHELEIALPHLLRGLEAMRSAKGRCAVLHLFGMHCGQLVTTAAALPALR